MENALKHSSLDKDNSSRSGPRKTAGTKVMGTLGRKVGLLLGCTVAVSLAVIAAGVHIGAHGEDRMCTGMVIWFAEFIQSL